jgi:hypothetical protein
VLLTRVEEITCTKYTLQTTFWLSKGCTLTVLNLYKSLFFQKMVSLSNTFLNFRVNFASQSTFMENHQILDDLSQIKGILEARTQFRTLSGLSGVVAGLWALGGAYVATQIIYNADHIIYDDIRAGVNSVDLGALMLVAVVTFLGALSTGIFFSVRNAHRLRTKFWNPVAAKLILNFSIPMAMGGVFLLALLYRGYYMLVAPTCLVFYGLALVNASNYTYSDIRKLGLAMLATGSVSLFLPGYGLYCWAFGFGVLHIVYGGIMYFKYEHK